MDRRTIRNGSGPSSGLENPSSWIIRDDPLSQVETQLGLQALPHSTPSRPSLCRLQR